MAVCLKFSKSVHLLKFLISVKTLMILVISPVYLLSIKNAEKNLLRCFVVLCLSLCQYGRQF